MLTKKLIFKISCLVVFIFMLSACITGLNSQFSCQSAKNYGRCLSLSEIDQKFDQGQLIAESDENLMYPQPQVTLPYTFESFNTDNTTHPLRRSETVKRIWIGPYEDTEGNYHQPSLIYTITQPGYWIDHKK